MQPAFATNKDCYIIKYVKHNFHKFTNNNIAN